jgi:hypothetical protein
MTWFDTIFSRFEDGYHLDSFEHLNSFDVKKMLLKNETIHFWIVCLEEFRVDWTDCRANSSCSIDNALERSGSG